MPVRLHIRDGGRFSARLGQRPSLTIVGDVDGISGNNSRMLFDAYNHPDMLRQGMAVRGIPNFIVTNVDGTVVGPDLVRFTLTAEERPEFRLQITRKEETREGLIQIGASLSTVTTERDKDGVPLTVTYTPDGGEPDTQGVEAEMSVPQAVRRIERVETNPNLGLADEFTGTVNERPIWGRDSRTLLVRMIQFTSRDGGATWLGNYEFQYKPETWDTYLSHRDEETKEPTVGITIENGIKRVRLLRETDFRRIGVDFPR